MTIDLSRRGFLAGLGAALITAPAIVRASSLMPVKALEQEIGLDLMIDGCRGPYWATVEEVTRRAFLPRIHVQLYEQSPFFAAMEKARRESGIV